MQKGKVQRRRKFYGPGFILNIYSVMVKFHLNAILNNRIFFAHFLMPILTMRAAMASSTEPSCISAIFLSLL